MLAFRPPSKPFVYGAELASADDTYSTRHLWANKFQTRHLASFRLTPSRRLTYISNAPPFLWPVILTRIYKLRPSRPRAELLQLVKRRIILRKNLLKLAVLLTFAAMVAVSMPRLSAQDAMSAPGAAGKEEAMQRLQKMSAALKLTPEQKKQVMPILMDEAPKMKALKADTSLGPMQKAMQMRQIANDTDTKLKPILSPQQYQTWQGMREQERQQMMQKMENK